MGSGGNLTTYAHNYGQFSNFYTPSVNNLGTVAFSGALDTGGISGIYRSNGGTISTILDNTGLYSNFPQFLEFNDNGVVAALASLDESGSAIIRIDGSTVDVIAGPPDVEINSVYVGLNNAGDVAFVAALSPTVNAILPGPDPVADKVIADGDSLFGSTIPPNYFNASIDGPNDAGQIAFEYVLADGRHGIALATPIPEELCIGDYNDDGFVDAADYAVWRDAMEAGAMTLTNRDPGNGGAVNEDDYMSWRGNFGMGPGGGAGARLLAPGDSPGANYAVPEPATATLLALAAMIVFGLARHRP